MNKIILVLFAVILSINSSQAQKDLNDYKYVIVPNNYNFFKEADQYQLNSLTKFLFNKYGFTALLADESFPEDLQLNNCLALKANVIKHASMFKTKLQVELKDCGNGLVYETAIGETKVKEFNKAYNLALRDAFNSFQMVNYKYSGKTTAPKMKAAAETKEVDDAELKTLKAKIKALESEKEMAKEKTDKAMAVKKVEKPVPSKVKQMEPVEKPNLNVPATENILYAQQTDNGYQVVDSTPKVVMILFNSGKANTFIVKDRDAIVYQEDGFWFVSESTGAKTKTERLNIKF